MAEAYISMVWRRGLHVTMKLQCKMTCCSALPFVGDTVLQNVLPRAIMVCLCCCMRNVTLLSVQGDCTRGRSLVRFWRSGDCATRHAETLGTVRSQQLRLPRRWRRRQRKDHPRTPIWLARSAADQALFHQTATRKRLGRNECSRSIPAATCFKRASVCHIWPLE